MPTDEEPPVFDNLDAANREIHSLRHLLRRRDRDNRILTRISEHTERMRQTFEKEKRLQFLYNDLLLSNTPNMIFLFNEQLEYIIGSSACRRLTGHGHTELSHRPIALLFRREVDLGWVENIRRYNEDVLRTLQPLSFHDTIEIAGEEVLHAHITISPMIDDNVCRGTITAINDVTELFLAQHRAEEAARSKAAFLANMSHEIRTPMNAIKGLSELLALTPLNPIQKNYVKNIVGSADSLISIVNDVLDFSKIDANRIEILPVTYALDKLLADIVGVIALRAEEKGLNLFIEAEPDLPSHLYGDDARIKQIVVNLLSNAVKYTQKGYVVLKVAGEKSGDRFELSFSIIDTGIGIKDEDMPHLYGAFTRVDLHTNRNIQGTGLGLAISKRLAEAMNGTIDLESEYGKGSTFTLVLPQDIADPSPLAPIENLASLRVLLLGNGRRIRNVDMKLEILGVKRTLRESIEGSMLDGMSEGPLSESGYSHCLYSSGFTPDSIGKLRLLLPNCRFGLLRSNIAGMDEPIRGDKVLFSPLIITELAKFLKSPPVLQNPRAKGTDTSISSRIQVRPRSRALVVDDNRINLMVCEKMLGLYGVMVTTASGAEEALALCEGNAYDILFVDHMMPGMDGVEMVGVIRKKPGPNQTKPIIALTANVVNDMRSFYLQAGMDDFVGKPIERGELARVLEKYLPNTETRKEDR